MKGSNVSLSDYVNQLIFLVEPLWELRDQYFDTLHCMYETNC